MFGKYKDKDKYLGKSIEIVDDLTKMIVEILSISSFHELKEKKELLRIYDEIKEIIKNYNLLIKEKNIKINYNLKDEQIYISKLAFDKIIINLISNSVKYTDQNGIINIGVKDGYFYIENSCKKLNKDQIEKSFELFYTEGKNNNSNGLGLYIIKNILTNYNIEYSFEKSKIGMLFKFKIPIKEQKNNSITKEW